MHARKTYSIEAVVAKVKSKILGWDFIRKYKFNWEWDQWGNIHLVDKKAQTRTLMQHIVVPQNSLPRFASLDLVKAGPAFSDFLFEVAAVDSVQIKEEKKIISPEYQALLDKYPSILKPNFNEVKTKHNVVHRIKTDPDATPC